MRTIALLALASFAMSATAEGWLCVSDNVVGFDPGERQSWTSKTFRASDKYVIRRSQNDGVVWEVIEVGESFPKFRCLEEFDRFQMLQCGIGLYAGFVFDREALNFSMFDIVSYFPDDDDKDKPGSLFLMIGRCTAI